MPLEELDKLIEKLDSMTYVNHGTEMWYIKGMKDTLIELHKDLNTTKIMNLSYLKEYLQSRYPEKF